MLSGLRLEVKELIMFNKITEKIEISSFKNS